MSDKKNNITYLYKYVAHIVLYLFIIEVFLMVHKYNQL